MATYNVTGVGGTTGHPSNARTPYLVENTIDVSAVNGDSGSAQNDVLKCIDVPAETLIMAAGVEVLTACSSSVVIDIGDNLKPLSYWSGNNLTKICLYNDIYKLYTKINVINNVWRIDSII